MQSIRITKSGVAGIGRRALQAIGRDAIHTTSVRWWAKFLPIHFTKRAVRLYNYKPRSGNPGSGRRFKGSYAESKLKRRKSSDGVRAIGENKPFVFTGRSREQATKQQNIQAVARSFSDYEGRVRLNAPALNFVPNAQRELRATVPAEETELEQVFGDDFEKGLNMRGRTRKTKTIK